jgi:hypothetical protein
MPENQSPTADRTAAGASSNCSGRTSDEVARRPTHDQPVIVGEFQANSRETARVSLEHFKGHDLVRLGKWYRDEHDVLRPGKGGIAVNVRHLPRLVELMSAALEQAREFGLIDPDSGDGDERP